MVMVAPLSSKCTPLTITLPLVMTPMETALEGPGGLLETPVPPVPPPQEASSAASAAIPVSRKNFMVAYPLASATPTLSVEGEFRSRRVCADRTGLRRRGFDLGQIVWYPVGLRCACQSAAVRSAAAVL